MILKELINKSYYGTIGYISSLDDLNLLESYILYNLPVLKEFKNVIVATNYKEIDLNTINRHIDLWEKYFPNAILIDSLENRGHNHGYTDLDNMLFDYCKTNDIEWLCKSANDTILDITILDKEIEEADFYYTCGFGYGGMVEYNFDYNKLLIEDFYPQTNFYFINVSKTDYINDKQFLDDSYNKIQQMENYNGRIWEYFPEWSCERFLRNCVIRNSLSKYNLVSKETYDILLEIVKRNQIHDPSHKNIMVEGICHLHFSKQDVIAI